MGEAHGVHVHALDEFHVFEILLVRQSASRFRSEAVSVHTTYVHLLAVDIETVAFSCLYRAETELVLLHVQRLAVGIDERECHLIAVRCLCRP